MLPDPPPACAAQMRAAATAVIQRHVARHGNATPLPGLTVCSVTAPVPAATYLGEPGLCLCIRGARRIVLGAREVVQDNGQLFLSAVGMPVEVAIADASPEEPYVALQLALDLEAARSVIAEMDPIGAADEDECIATSPVGTALLEAAVRLVMLLEDGPAQAPVLPSLRQRELLYQVLAGEAGARLRAVVRTATEHRGIVRAVAWIRAHLAERLRVEELAALAGMGVSTLHRRFLLVTGRSPLQFQKHLRLHETRRLMLVDRLDAAESAYRVGYESVPQFHREYRRLFGRPPRQDVQSYEASTSAPPLPVA